MLRVFGHGSSCATAWIDASFCASVSCRCLAASLDAPPVRGGIGTPGAGAVIAFR